MKFITALAIYYTLRSNHFAETGGHSTATKPKLQIPIAKNKYLAFSHFAYIVNVSKILGPKKLL
jgi:hypothetical protein